MQESGTFELQNSEESFLEQSLVSQLITYKYNTKIEL